MYRIEIYNSNTDEIVGDMPFDTKKDANAWLRKNSVLRGHDYYAPDDYSVEYHKCY